MQRFTATQEVLQSLIEASVIGILVVDPDGNIVLDNPFCCTLFGYSEGELVGKPILKLVPPNSRNEHQDLQKKFFANPEARPMGQGLETYGLHSSGRSFPVAISLSYIQHQNETYAIVYVADITQQQQITDQNTLLSKIFQESLDGIYIINADTLQFDLANRGALQQLGYSLPELRKFHPWDLTPQEDRADFLKRVRALPNGKSHKVSFETLYKRNDGTHLPVEVHLQTFSYDHRSVFMQIVIDISQRKGIEEALQLQSEITRNLHEGVLLVRASDVSIVYTNTQLDRMFGYEPSELVGQPLNLLNASTDNSSEEILLTITNSLQETGSWVGEVCHQHKQGYTFWCWVSITTFEHPAYGTVWVGLLSDIDQRKKVEAALEKEREKAQMYLDVAGSIFVVIEKDRTVSLINQKGCELLGYSEEEVLGTDWFSNYIPESEQERVVSVFDQAMNGDIDLIEHFTNRIVTRHQGERLIEWHNAIIEDESGNPTAGLSSGIDITEKVKAEQEKTQALIQGQELERKRIAEELHDGLGQSLTAIRLHLNALEFDMNRASEQNKEALEKLKMILQTTTQEVKAISRDLMPSILQDYGLVKAIEFLCKTINEAHPAQVLFSVYHLDHQLAPSLNLGLYRVAQELINNAVKHAKSKTVNVQLIGHKDSIVLVVEDDGIGFDASQKSSTKPTLGLQNIKTRVKSLSGNLEIDSRPGEGTSITVEIPLY